LVFCGVGREDVECGGVVFGLLRSF